MSVHKRHLKNLWINALGRFMNIYADIVGLNKFAIKQPAKQFQCTFDLVTLLVFEKTMVFCYQNCSDQAWFWPSVRINCHSDREKLMKFEAEGR